MKKTIFSWLAVRYKIVVNSIAFYPAFIAVLFLVLSYLMIYVDFSEFGKQIKTSWRPLQIKDANTARTIISVIAAGIISLTVFSFTMVMVILNQVASKMSNRILDKMIGNRFQQLVLGFYIGTIVYSFFLLTVIRDNDTGIQVPSLSTYLLIFFAIADMFLFIYFLHYITQSVKYSVTIRRIYKQTKSALESACRLHEQPELPQSFHGTPIYSFDSGLFVKFNKGGIKHLMIHENSRIAFIHSLGTYILKNTAIAYIDLPENRVSAKLIEKINECLYFMHEDNVEMDYYFGFRQLTEIAIKALSPGINDPGTAIESLRALSDLLYHRLHYFPDNLIKDENDIVRIITKEKTFGEIFDSCMIPIWNYGKEDRFIQQEMDYLLQTLAGRNSVPEINRLLNKIQTKLRENEN